VVLCQEWKREALPKRGAVQEKPKLIARVLFPDHEERFEIGPRGGQTPAGVFPHSFGRVPLVKLCRRSELEDIARIQVSVFNEDSMISEQERRQTFNQLVLSVSDPKSAMGVVVGTDAVLPLKTGDTAAWLSPNVQTIAALRECVSEKIDEMWAMANLRSRPGGKGSQPATDTSGVAYAYEWHSAEADLAGIATTLEEAERKILGMYARAIGNDAEPKVSYSREFDIRALRARADEIVASQKIGIGKTAEGQMLKAFARKANPGATAKDLKAFDEEIDALAEVRYEKALEGGPPEPGPSTPPNQGMLPPGQGSQKDRAMQPADGEGTAEPASDTAEDELYLEGPA
jgi:hypothetical protein